MKKAILKHQDWYGFYDDPTDEDIQMLSDKIIGIVNVEDEVGFHRCNKSAIWDDMTGYLDIIQDEEKLPDNKSYIVCYYKCNKDGDLEQFVDYGISKQQILDNICNQKYVEGADYFISEQLKG